MSIKNIKPNLRQERGFTIVELLIVVVVIAILAAITIVSYNGITNRANASAAKSTAATVQKKVELYNSEVGRYPVTAAELSDTAKSYGIPSGTFGATAPVTTTGATQGTKYVQLQACTSAASPTALSTTNVTGARITYYEYDKATPGLTNIDVGDCSVRVLALG